jgi:Putative DNA-binding domain
MTILTQPADAIQKESLLSFLAERVPESINLEYKVADSSRIVESVAAMANTYGGAILVGVGEKNGVPIIDPAGVPLATMSAIVNRCWTVLDPPFAPEIVPVALDEADDRYVLVIRVDEVRVDRPVLVDGRAKIRLSGRNATAGRRQLAALFAEQVSSSGPVISASGNYGARNAHPLLRMDEEGLGIRLALTARVTPAGAPFFGSAIHDQLEEALYKSPLEQWLRTSTDILFDRRGDIETWRRTGWNTSSVVTFTREPVKTVDEHFSLKAQCVLEAPHGPRRCGFVSLLLGLALEPEPDQPYKALVLEELYQLAHALYATALDVVAPAIFGEIVGTPLWEPMGPHLHIDPGNNRTLAEYVQFSGVRRAPDTPELTVSSLEVPYGEDVRDPVRRDELIKGWLIKTLLDGGYTGVEAKVDALQPPEVR